MIEVLALERFLSGLLYGAELLAAVLVVYLPASLLWTIARYVYWDYRALCAQRAARQIDALLSFPSPSELARRFPGPSPRQHAEIESARQWFVADEYERKIARLRGQ